MPAKPLLTYSTYYTFSLQVRHVQEQEHGSYRHPNGGGLASIEGSPESPGSIVTECSLQNAMSPGRRCAKCMTPPRLQLVDREGFMACVLWPPLFDISESDVWSKEICCTAVTGNTPLLPPATMV